jgi:Zn ribbon nucleic-acid-binding protein
MWNWFSCYLSGRHEFGMWCERGAIFLRCVHCGRRSTGWDVNTKPHAHTHASPAAMNSAKAHVVPFDRPAAQ